MINNFSHAGSSILKQFWKASIKFPFFKLNLLWIILCWTSVVSMIIIKLSIFNELLWFLWSRKKTLARLSANASKLQKENLFFIVRKITIVSCCYKSLACIGCEETMIWSARWATSKSATNQDFTRQELQTIRWMKITCKADTTFVFSQKIHYDIWAI